jgi:thiol-disulfide isomerase/thioredoxin
MKNLIVFCLFLISNILMAQGIVFETGTWEEVSQKAENEDKLIFVDAYTTWCGPCKAMAANVFTHADVGSFYNKTFLNVKMDMESPAGREFGKKYPVSAYPTLLFINGSGKVVKKVIGGQQVAGFLALGAETAKLGGPSIEELEAKFNSGDKSYKVVQKYVSAIARSGKSTTKLLNEYFNSNPPITANEKAMLLYEASLDADSKIFEMMVGQKNNLLNLVGESAYNEKVKSACSATVKKAIEHELTILLEEAITKGYQYLTVGAKEFELKSRLDYAKSFKDNNSYLKNVTEYADFLIKKNSLEVHSVINEMCSLFSNDKKITKKANDLAQSIYKKEQNYVNLGLYATTLSVNGESKDAISLVEKAKSKVDKSNIAELQKYDAMLDKLKSYQSSK